MFLLPAVMPSSIILLKSKGCATTKKASITTIAISSKISFFKGLAYSRTLLTVPFLIPRFLTLESRVRDR